MHLVVDADWAKAHPRRAAKIQVAYLLRIARMKGRPCMAEPDATGQQRAQAPRDGRAKGIEGP